MATEAEIQEALNGVTACLNTLGDVDWAAYAVSGPGMAEIVSKANQVAAMSGMSITLVAAMLAPIGDLADALDQAMRAGT